MKEKVIKKFDDLFDDDTKNAVKIKKEDYLSSGKNIIIDQNSCDEYGYTNINDGIYKDVPTIVFGDHTRVIKYIEKPFFLGADGAKIIKQKSKDNQTKYLYYYLKSKKIENLGYSRHYKLLKELSFEICEKDEQKKIIFVLDCINNIKDLYQSQLKSLDLLVKSRFVEMFGDGKYEIKKLKDVSNLITDGTHITPNYLLDGIKFISAKNIVNGKINFDDIKYISEEEYNKIQNRCKVEKNDVLLTKSGTLGSCAVVDIDDKIGLFESLAIIKYKREIINPIYLCEMIKSDNVQSQFKQNEKGLAVKHLHLNVIKDIDIMVPPIELQESYASFVDQVDKSKFVVQEALNKTKMLMDSLMQEYFG